MRTHDSTGGHRRRRVIPSGRPHMSLSFSSIQRDRLLSSAEKAPLGPVHVFMCLYVGASFSSIPWTMFMEHVHGSWGGGRAERRLREDSAAP